MTEILQTRDTEKGGSLGTGWSSVGSVFLFLPLSILIVLECGLFAKTGSKDGREEGEAMP